MDQRGGQYNVKEAKRRLEETLRGAREDRSHGIAMATASDANGQQLAYIYSRETTDAAHIAKVLTEDEARCIASNIAKLPTLLVARPQIMKEAYTPLRTFPATRIK